MLVMPHTALRIPGWPLAACWPLLAACALAAAPAAEQQPACQLILEGRPVEKLTLIDDHEQTLEFIRPGSGLSLPPGRYHIHELSVQWDDDGPVWTGEDLGLITLDTTHPCHLDVGSSKAPRVVMNRRGPILSFRYDPVIGNKAFSTATRASRPQFAAYQKGEKVGTGTFEYG